MKKTAYYFKTASSCIFAVTVSTSEVEKKRNYRWRAM